MLSMRHRTKYGVGAFILEALSILDYQGHYRDVRRAIREYQSGVRGTSDRFILPEDRVLRTTLSRLKKQGLLANSGGIWRATVKGREFIKSMLGRKRGKELAKQPKNLIVAFDVPEKYARQRYWLRLELKNMGFVMLQKSVWFGPGPLPKEFVRWLQKSNILGYLKFFRAAPEEIV